MSPGNPDDGTDWAHGWAERHESVLYFGAPDMAQLTPEGQALGGQSLPFFFFFFFFNKFQKKIK